MDRHETRLMSLLGTANATVAVKSKVGEKLLPDLPPKNLAMEIENENNS